GGAAASSRSGVAAPVARRRRWDGWSPAPRGGWRWRPDRSNGSVAPGVASGSSGYILSRPHYEPCSAPSGNPNVTPSASAPPAAETGTRLAELLTSAARRFHRGAGARLAPLGLTWAQARVMRLIAAPGSSMRMADIASHLGVVP